MERPEFKITLKSTGSGSDRLGVCESCGGKCVEVFSLRIQKSYYSVLLGRESYTFDGGLSMFGHEQCLRDARMHFTRGKKNGQV